MCRGVFMFWEHIQHVLKCLNFLKIAQSGKIYLKTQILCSELQKQTYI